MEVEKRFFHELTKEEIDKLIADKADLGFVINNFKQPDWCGYTDALNGPMGCWSLMDLYGTREKISHEFCKDCDCYISSQIPSPSI